MDASPFTAEGRRLIAEHVASHFSHDRRTRVYTHELEALGAKLFHSVSDQVDGNLQYWEAGGVVYLLHISAQGEAEVDVIDYDPEMGRDDWHNRMVLRVARRFAERQPRPQPAPAVHESSLA